MANFNSYFVALVILALLGGSNATATWAKDTFDLKVGEVTVPLATKKLEIALDDTDNSKRFCSEVWLLDVCITFATTPEPTDLEVTFGDNSNQSIKLSETSSKREKSTSCFVISPAEFFKLHPNDDDCGAATNPKITATYKTSADVKYTAAIHGTRHQVNTLPHTASLEDYPTLYLVDAALCKSDRQCLVDVERTISPVQFVIKDNSTSSRSVVSQLPTGSSTVITVLAQLKEKTGTNAVNATIYSEGKTTTTTKTTTSSALLFTTSAVALLTMPSMVVM